MEIAELQHITLDVLKDLYTSSGKDVHNHRFRQELSTRGIYSRVALRAYTAGLWKPSERLAQENATYAGEVFPKADVSSVRSILWRFVGLGILTPRQMTDEDNQFFELSKYGEEVLAESEESPYDPFGFLRYLRANSPNLEPNSFAFIQEAIDCFLGRHLRASMVMVGLTSENEILTLIELYRNTLDSEQKETFGRKISSCKTLKLKFDLLYEHLFRIRKELPPEIRELDTWLKGIFQVIRMSRNDAGHPIGTNPTSEDVFSNLILFRTYARYLSKLKEYLANNKK
jgi:hypothetical protein